MRRICTLIAATALLVSAVPAMAMAQGNAGVDEYTETVPGAGGDKPSMGGGGDGSGESSGGGPLTPSQVAALEEQGPDGAAAAGLAQSTGPDSKGTPGGKEGESFAGTEAPSGAPGSDTSGSGIPGAIGDLAGGSDSGMGLVLPIVLVAALLGAVAFVIARRGGGQAGPA